MGPTLASTSFPSFQRARVSCKAIQKGRSRRLNGGQGRFRLEDRQLLPKGERFERRVAAAPEAHSAGGK